MKPVHVFFFRGLSTYGLDDAKWSIFNFGPMARNIVRAFGEREVHVHPVAGMGIGSLEEMAARALDRLNKNKVWLESRDEPIHFLGHSAGGLVARLVLNSLPPNFEKRVKSLVTFGTPNAGSEIAQLCIDMPKNSVTSLRLLRACGYDIASNGQFFKELTRERVATLKMPTTKIVKLASVVCYSPREEFCLPLKMFYKIPAFSNFSLDSDGFVERASQPFGDVIAEVNIDHMRQIGLFGQPQRFHKLCDVLTDYFKKNS